MTLTADLKPTVWDVWNIILGAFLCVVGIVPTLRYLHLILSGDTNCSALYLVPAKWRWSVLVVVLLSRKYPRWETVSAASGIGDKQSYKGVRGMFPPGWVLGRLPSSLCSLQKLKASWDFSARGMLCSPSQVACSPMPMVLSHQEDNVCPVRRCWSAYWPPARGTMAGMSFVWSPRRASANKGLSLTQDWRNGVFFLLQLRPCVTYEQCQEVMTGKEQYSIQSSEYLVHWQTNQNSWCFYYSKPMCIFSVFSIFFFKTAFPIIVSSWSVRISITTW